MITHSERNVPANAMAIYSIFGVIIANCHHLYVLSLICKLMCWTLPWQAIKVLYNHINAVKRYQWVKRIDNYSANRMTLGRNRPRASFFWRDFSRSQINSYISQLSDLYSMVQLGLIKACTPFNHIHMSKTFVTALKLITFTLRILFPDELDEMFRTASSSVSVGKEIHPLVLYQMYSKNRWWHYATFYPTYKQIELFIQAT